MKLIFLFITFSLVTITIGNSQFTNEKEINCQNIQKIINDFKKPSYEVTATVYHPTKRQTDNSPLITADNSKIDLNKLKKGELNWIALSRDLLKRWGGDLDYGDVVKITGNKSINGKYVIHDTMNDRYNNRIDILSHKNGIYGKWNNIKIKKV